MNESIRHLPQRDCPDCIDTVIDNVHLFNICPVHLGIGQSETEEERLAREDYERRVASGDPTQLGYG